MQIQPGRTYRLRDRDQRDIGSVEVETATADLIEGVFRPGPDYPAVSALLRRFEEAVELQALSVLDILDKDIARLGLTLWEETPERPLVIEDVQIYGDGAMSCRPSPLKGAVAGQVDNQWVHPTISAQTGGQARQPPR